MLNDKPLDSQTSGTALDTAFVRALAAQDPRPEIRCADDLAEIFLDEERRRPLQDEGARQWVRKTRLAPGVYEFMTARTAFFDEVLRTSLGGGTRQIVFLGAGYDSRPYRFRELIGDASIFELDTAPTQARKRERLHACAVPFPPHLTFVPVNFESEDFTLRLLESGYDAKKQSLFIWEGVSYYLTAAAVDGVLAFVASHSPSGSSVAFDYGAVSPESLKEAGGRKLREHLQSRHSDEPIRFAIPAGTASEFLRARGFEIIRHLSSTDMKERYLGGDRYPDLGAPPSLLCLVHARVV